VRIDAHGPQDRVKDASPERMRRSLVPALGAYALWRMPTTFPSSAPFGHPRSPARRLLAGDTATCRRTDQDPRSNGTPRRVPPSGRSGCLSPPRHAKELFLAKGSLPPAFAPALSLTPPTLCPQGGDSVLDWALQGHGAVTRGSVTVREDRCLFDLLELPCLGLTTQARHQDRSTRPSTRTDCLARTDADRSA